MSGLAEVLQPLVQSPSSASLGIDLGCNSTPVFGHGQFYVGVSRGTNWSRVKVLLNEGEKTANIVYKDVLLRPR